MERAEWAASTQFASAGHPLQEPVAYISGPPAVLNRTSADNSVSITVNVLGWVISMTDSETWFCDTVA